MAKKRWPQAEQTCREWNEAYPVGTAVVYDSVIGGRGLVAERTRSRAVVLPGGKPGLWITRRLCAVTIRSLALIDDAAVPPLSSLLLERSRPLRKILYVQPAMEWDGFAFHDVKCLRIDTQQPCFTAPLMHPLPGQRECGGIGNVEGLNQLHYVVGRYQAFDVVLIVHTDAKVRR